MKWQQLRFVHAVDVCCAGELGAFQDVIGTGDQTEMLSRLVTRVANLETVLAQTQMQRRQLHNELIGLRGNVRACSGCSEVHSVL